jgi:tetratricopeptide (TPR) repeat protein
VIQADPLLEAVRRFLTAETWEAARAVVGAEPELLDEGAQALLRDLESHAANAGDADSAAVLHQHRTLLEECRRDGVETAFARLVGGGGRDRSLEDVLAELGELSDGGADILRQIELCRAGLALLPKAEDPALWALLQARLGTALMMSPSGAQTADREASIAALQAAAREFERLELHYPCSQTFNNLGLALEARALGDPDENAAIEAYSSALEHVAVLEEPLQRAEILNNLANVYSRRRRGLRDDNRDRAIGLYEQALELVGEDAPATWIATRVNLGIALIESFRGDRRENLDRAIEYFLAALERIDPGVDPADWAHVQVNLGNALVRRADGDDLSEAIVAYESALEIYADQRRSLNRALALSNLGNALLARARPEAIERAIGCYREALEILSPSENPLDWAMTQNNLGRAFRDRAEGDKAENLEQAIGAFERAAEAMDPRSLPVEYAQIQKNLGSAYRKRVGGDRPESLRRSLAALSRALEIREEVYGPGHPRVASVLYSIARTQHAADDDDAARRSLERALAIDEARAGEPPAHLARGYRRLAATADRLGDLDAAEHALERALTVDTARGDSHPDVFTDLRLLADVRRRNGRDGAAVDALTRAVDISLRDEDDADGGVREALGDLATLLRKAGDLAGAERTLEQAVALDEALFGSRHPRLAESLVKLAGVLGEAQELTRARTTIERAARIERATSGRLPPGVSATLATLASALAADAAAAARVMFSEEFEGRLAAWAISLRLQVTVDDLDRLLSDPEHVATVTGSVECAEMGGELPVRRGTYAIRPDAGATGRRGVAYELQAGDHVIRGLRIVDDADSRGAVRLRLLAGDAEGEAAVPPAALRRHLASIRVDAPTPAGQAAVRERFCRASLGARWLEHPELASLPPGLV